MFAGIKAKNRLSKPKRVEHSVVCDTGLTRRLAYVFIGAPIHARKTYQNGENAKQQCAVKLEQSK